MKYNYQEKVSVLVSSCDKYRTAWYPYFSLLRKFWVNCPKRIYLISETEDFQCKDLPIMTFKDGKGKNWSELLLSALGKIQTEYVIFSLEDFFVVDYIKEDEIERCLEMMENDHRIAEIRFKPSSLDILKGAENYGEFKIAPKDTPYRVDTQVGLWRKESLASLIDHTETAWQFEKNATLRAKARNQIFLWIYSNAPYNKENMIFPYYLDAEEQFVRGYSIAWGKWLWNNKKIFEANGIYDVNYKEIGTLSKRGAEIKRKYYFRVGKGKANILERIIRGWLGFVYAADRSYREIRLGGLDGVKVLKRKMMKRMMCKNKGY